MKVLILATAIFATGCVEKEESSKQSKSVQVVEGYLNNYELIRIGEYECVGMDGFKSGGVWCTKLDKK